MAEASFVKHKAEKYHHEYDVYPHLIDCTVQELKKDRGGSHLA